MLSQYLFLISVKAPLPNLDRTLSNSDLFTHQQNSSIWDQWMCMLAETLTPEQWHAYWQVYISMFGTESLPQNLELFDALCWASSSTTIRLVLIYHNKILLFIFSEPNTLNTYFTTTDQPSASNISHDSSTASLGSLLPPLLFGQSAAFHAHYLEGWFESFKPLGVFL